MTDVNTRPISKRLKFVALLIALIVTPLGVYTLAYNWNEAPAREEVLAQHSQGTPEPRILPIPVAPNRPVRPSTLAIPMPPRPTPYVPPTPAGPPPRLG